MLDKEEADMSLYYTFQKEKEHQALLTWLLQNQAANSKLNIRSMFYTYKRTGTVKSMTWRLTKHTNLLNGANA